MADKKISELTNITGANLADDDEFVVVDTSASETKAITYAELKKFNGLVTLGSVSSTSGDLNLDTLDLNAIATSKAVTAVDVFVYDTSKDSDGGAWRKRTQHTSWYNETLNTATRGSRREFPAVAVIVAEATKVTIYDGDDPALPMWMVFNSDVAFSALNSGVTSVAAQNGLIAVGTNLTKIDFVSDTIIRYRSQSLPSTPLILGHYKGSISERNAGRGWDQNTAFKTIADDVVNDVAMTVLPDAPIDPATGLPVPTIACLVAETEVLMADGSTKRLDQVQPGEMVKTLEGEHKVLNWWDQGIKDVIELEFDGGHKIICTADHKIRTTTGWVEAGDLTEDHEVVVA